MELDTMSKSRQCLLANAVLDSSTPPRSRYANDRTHPGTSFRTARPAARHGYLDSQTSATGFQSLSVDRRPAAHGRGCGKAAQCEQRLGMGSLFAEGATTSGDPHGRRYAAIPSKRD